MRKKPVEINMTSLDSDSSNVVGYIHINLYAPSKKQKATLKFNTGGQKHFAHILSELMDKNDEFALIIQDAAHHYSNKKMQFLFDSFQKQKRKEVADKIKKNQQKKKNL